MTIAKALNQVKEDIKPSPKTQKEMKAIATAALKKVQKAVPNAKAVLGGSGAKGTWLDAFDIDIFVLFPYDKYAAKSDALSQELHKKLKNVFSSIKRLHGSRDYFQITYKKHTIEIVPLLHITTPAQAKNITDISPLHTKWVLKNKKYQEEIRLTKQFFKSQGIYGAESYLAGFSGYVCEILTINYGSFKKLLQQAAKWKKGTVIDAEKHYKGKNVRLEMNVSKLTSPLIVVDPVQKERNAAAALSEEKWEKCRQQAKKFLKSPSPHFFYKESLSSSSLAKRHPKAAIAHITLTPLKGKKDVVGAKIKKVFIHCKKALTHLDFDLIHADWEWTQKAHLWFVVSQKTLQKEKVIAGPPTKIKSHVKNFKKKYANTFVKNGHVMAKQKRSVLTIDAAVKKIIKDAYVKERVQSISVVKPSKQ